MRENVYGTLLEEYCDGLLRLQIKGAGRAFDGGFMCRSCKMIHGRSPDAVYPLAVMYKRTGKKKYLDAAIAVFHYGKNMECDDGSLYNDAQAGWLYTTVFHNIAVIETLNSLKGKLPNSFEAELTARARRMSEWLYRNLDEHSRPNINYCASNALAMMLAYKLFGEDKYRARAERLAKYTAEHFSENGLLFGESKNHDEVSPLGCRSVDIGYDLEETIPNLVKYAHIAGDEGLLSFLSEKLLSMTDFILPDGGLDNSFGVRNNKWTYYGSRTSDGICPAYLLLADRNPVFAEAAHRNAELLMRCSGSGLLYGGPHYQAHGEEPCTHHTFEHANALAFAVDTIDEKYLIPAPCSLPIEQDGFCKYYREINTYKFTKGNLTATVTGYDFNIPFSGHASGGTLTMLFGKNVGPMVAASVTDYVLVEPTNMQLPLKKSSHRSLTPRLVVDKDGAVYSSSWFASPTMKLSEGKDVRLAVKTGLSTIDGEQLALAPEIVYTLTGDKLKIEISHAEGLKFILPLIAGKMEVLQGTLIAGDEIFFLTGGFIATEHIVSPDENGKMTLVIRE